MFFVSFLFPGTAAEDGFQDFRTANFNCRDEDYSELADGTVVDCRFDLQDWKNVCRDGDPDDFTEGLVCTVT